MIISKKKVEIIYRIAFIVVGAFNFILLLNHEFWRDEAQAWLIARDTVLTPGSLFTVTSYEGHPFLWFLILMPFAKLGVPVFALKLISYAFVMAALWLFLYKTDFPWVLKCIGAFSPMFLYFLVVPARSYSLAAFLMIYIISIYKSRNERPLLYGISLSLLLQTLTIYGGFVFICALIWTIEIAIEIKSGQYKKNNLFQKVVSLVIVFFSGLFLLWEFRFVGRVIAEPRTSTWRGAVKEVVYQIVCGFKELFQTYHTLVMALFLLVFTYMFIKDKCKGACLKAIIVFLVSIGWQIYIYAFVYNNTNHRLLSWLFIILFVVNMLLPMEENGNFDWKKGDFSIRQCAIFITAITIIFSLNYMNEKFVDAIKPGLCFSHSDEIAREIEKLPENAIIFITSSDYDSGVVAQVKKHAIYSPFTRTKASYADRNPDFSENMTYQDFVSTITDMFPEATEAYVIVGSEVCGVEDLDEIVEDNSDVLTKYYVPEEYPYYGETFYLLKINLN